MPESGCYTELIRAIYPNWDVIPTGAVITPLIGVFSLILFCIVSMLKGVMPIASASLHSISRLGGAQWNPTPLMGLLSKNLQLILCTLSLFYGLSVGFHVVAPNLLRAGVGRIHARTLASGQETVFSDTLPAGRWAYVWR